MLKGAMLNADRTHRWVLWRVWDESLPGMLVIGLNPSTADENEDDPTIRRCIEFAKREGAGSLFMVNMFSFRSTDPLALRGKTPKFLTGDGWNDTVIAALARRQGYPLEGDVPAIPVDKIVAAWGVHGKTPFNHDLYVANLLRDCDVLCFGTTKNGQPKHPLYLRKDTPLEKWAAVDWARRHGS